MCRKEDELKSYKRMLEEEQTRSKDVESMLKQTQKMVDEKNDHVASEEMARRKERSKKHHMADELQATAERFLTLIFDGYSLLIDQFLTIPDNS